MELRSLKQNHLFSKAYKKGKKSVHKSVCVYCMRNYRENGTYLGITVSTKQGGAVERNRAKRVIRAAYRNLSREKNPFLKDYILVIVARSGCYDGTFSSDDVKRDLRSAFDRLGIMNDLQGNE